MLKKKRPILVVAGEASGDERAAELVSYALKLQPDIHFFGVGGECLRKAGVEILVDIKETAVFGILEAFTQISKLKKIMNTLLSEFAERRAEEALLVDFGGFNLRLAAKLKKQGGRVGYYVSPQVWASRPKRAIKVRESVDLMMVLFDFEKAFYKKWDVDAVHVGHPLLDTVRSEVNKADILVPLGFSPEKKTIALMPGSRDSEIQRLLPPILETVNDLHSKGYEQFLLIAAPGRKEELEELTRGMPVKVTDSNKYSVISASDLVILASGTAALEVALLGVPAIVIYKTSRITFFLAQFLMNLEYVSLPNIILGEMFYPELIQKDCTHDKILEESLAILEDQETYDRIRDQLGIVKKRLGQPGAIKAAAQHFVAFLEKE